MLWGEDGYMIYNDAYSVFAGGRHPEQLGMKVREGWAEVAAFNDNVMRVGLAGGTLHYKDQELTLHRTGKPEPVWMNLDYSPVLDESGEPAGVIAVVIETTERVLAERRAAEAGRGQRQMLRQMPGFVAMLRGPDFIYEYVNDAYVKISQRADFIGRGFKEVFSDLEGQGFFELLDGVYSSNEARVMRGMELRLNGADEPQYIDFLFEPIRDEAGSVNGIFIGGYEVTDSYRAAAALQRSEEQLRLATENAEVGLWDVDVATDTLFWPPRVKAMFGISADVPVSMDDFYDGLHPDDRERTAQAYARAADPDLRALYDVDYRTIGAEDGVIRWVAARGRGVFDEAGACVRMLGTALDITERKRVEERLQELNADLERQVIERTQARGLVWQLTPDLMGALNSQGYFETSNPAWKTVLGWSEEEVASLSIFELLHPDDVERTREGFDLTQIGQPAIRFPNRYRCKGGGYRWISWVGVPDEGMVYCTGRDITAEKAQEAELAAANAERDRMWRNAQDVITVIDLSGVIQAVNPAVTERLGWAPEEMVGRSVLEFIHADDHPPLRDGSLVEERYDAPRVFHNRFLHKDGSYRSLAWFSSLYEGLIYSSGRDETLEKQQAEALRAAEESLRQSQKMEAVGQLTGGIAHDFNNLLTGITGSLELLQSRVAQGRFDAVNRYVTAAQGAARRAAALTHRLLAFSRRQTLDPKTTDVNRLVTDMEDLIRRTVGPAVSIEVVGAGGLWATLVDPNQLENALLNLCINARDAMPEGGRITIETANKWLDERAGAERDLPAGQYVSLCVTDTGTGMSPEVAGRAFDPFFTTKPMGQGTGLGLSMIYGFVRQSGGQVRIYSELGKGTTMCLYLPRDRAMPAASDMSLAEPAMHPKGSGEVVLVVDDEPTVRMLIAEVLNEAGYAGIEAADGPSGLKVLQSNTRIDLLVTDVGLPGGMNGRQIADAARVLRPGLKVLFITGYAENAAVGNGHLDPGMEVLTKPFAMEALAQRIRRMIES